MSPPPDPSLDDEVLAALARAARLAGDPALLPRLEELVATYHEERALVGPRAPRLGDVRKLLLSRARALDRARDALTPGPCERPSLDAVAFLIAPDIEAAAFALAEQARKCRVAAAGIEHGDRRSADRQPGGPLWRLVWGLGEAFADAGNRVGVGCGSAFHAFVGEVFAALVEPAPERLLNEVARLRQQRAGSLTMPAQKEIVASFSLAS